MTPAEQAESVILYRHPGAMRPNEYELSSAGAVTHWTLPGEPPDVAAVAATQEYQDWLLRQAQDARAAQVDARTAELLAAGFEFPPGSGQRFDLSAQTQGVWLSLIVAAQAGLLSYPVSAGIIADGVYLLEDAAAVLQFCGSGLARGREIVESGAVVKRLIYAAQTQEALEAVADSRE